MTEPTQQVQVTPRTEGVTLTITASPDLLGIVKAREIEQTLRRLVDRTWGSGVTVERAIEAEAARSVPVAEGLREARSIIRQLSNALMWCDTRYRQTLEGKPVRDVTELRHEVVAVLDASGRFLDRATPPDPAADFDDPSLHVGDD